MNILIGSNGGLTGIYLAKRFALMGDTTVFGADATPMSPGRFFVKRQFLLPLANDQAFLGRLIDTLNENAIDIYIPTHSAEIREVAFNADAIRKQTSARFIVSPKETFFDLENKHNANINFSRIGIPVPRLIRTYDCEYPIIMKKDIGSGSAGTIKIENSQIHRAFKETMPKVSFYQLVKGQEYTVDCMFDDDCRLIGFNPRIRVKTIGGAVSVTTNSRAFDIKPFLEKIAKHWRFKGCVNFQYIVEDGIPYFIDVNLRFPSGGLPLTVASGLNIPELMVDILKGHPIQEYYPREEFDNLTMYRYFEEIFSDDTV